MAGQPTDEPLDLSFMGQLERSPARGGWTYVVTPWTRVLFATRGRVRVRGTVDGCEFHGTFLALGDGRHKLALSVAVRDAIGKHEGDTVEFHLTHRVDAPARPLPAMSLDDVAALAMTLPGTTEGVRFGQRTWFANHTGYVWERPLTKADVRRLDGADEPTGQLVAVRLADFEDTAAVLAVQRPGVFTIAHFTGHPAVLLQLEVASRATVAELIVDAWSAATSTAR
jgi:hypothetical protein